MKIMLTSFGIDRTAISGPPERSLFGRMPPVSFRQTSSAFMPDYELLVLCDQIVMDESSFQELINSPFPVYRGVAETFLALKAEGRIELVDFPSILRRNSDLLDKMLDHDIKVLDQWVEPLRESLAIWRRFATRSQELWRGQMNQILPNWMAPSPGTRTDLARYLHDEIQQDALLAKFEADEICNVIDVALASAEKRKHKEFRRVLRAVTQTYLGYVNANLVLAGELAIPFHDWLDFTPFYSTKFLSVGKREPETELGRRHVERLFTAAFPELAIQDTRTLLKVINDNRVQDLRKLIDKAVRGEIQFDEHFANSVLAEVLQNERRVARFRNVLGYLTLPIGFIPWIGTPAQKLLEEAIATPVAKKMKQKHQWFYMLSDISDFRGEREQR